MKRVVLFLVLFVFSQLLNSQTVADTTVVLSEINIQVVRFPMLNAGHSKQLDITSSLSSQTNTVAESFRQLPSLVADMEGGIIYRGAITTGFLLNGVPYGLMEENAGDVLIQFPALFFNRIYLNSFPSINYGPEGEVGILNLSSSLYTKKEASLLLTVGGALEDRYNIGVLINQHPGKFHITGKYNYRREYRKRSFRKTTTNASSITEMNNSASARPDVHVADLLVGYDLTPVDQLSVYGMYYLMDYNRYGGINTARYNPEGEIINKMLRHRNNEQKQEAYAVEARWKHNFRNQSDQLNVLFNYNNFVYNEDNDYQNENIQGTIIAQDNLYIRQQKDNYYLSGFYRKGLTGQLRLNIGYQGKLKKENYTSAASDCKNEEWIENRLKSDTFDLKRTSQLLFLSLEKQWENLLVELGVQGEYFWQKAGRKENDSFYLYPRLSTSFRMHDTGVLNLTYQQRVIRPYGAALNSFIDRSDATFLKQGNPDLKNEQVHLLELSSPFIFSNVLFSPAVYYRYRRNRVMDVLYEENELSVWRKENTGHSQTVGGEFSLNWNLHTLLSVGTSGNIYRDEIDGRQIGYSEKKSLVCYDVKGFVQISLTPATELQLDAFWVSDQLTPQGEIKSRSSVNAGFSHYFADRKLRLNLSVNNLFDGLKEITVIDTESLQMRQERNRDVRVGWLTLTYAL